MFTGIVECVGIITAARIAPGGRHFCIDAGPMANECALGVSICVSGVCLTVSDVQAQTLAFDVITETLGKTALGSKRVGDRVNLERSLRVGDRLDGHFVQGHVDGTATVERVVKSLREYVVRLRPEPSLTPYIVPKGSVALDGVSMTIASVESNAFSVALIPTTRQRTTLSLLTAGDRVNVETDILVRTIVHHLSEMTAAEGLTLGTLREA